MASEHSCSCQRSKCRQKYCECFAAGVPCGDRCKCKDCQNDGQFRADLHDWMLPDSKCIPEATRSSIGTKSVIVLQQECGHRHKQPHQAAGPEAPISKFPPVPTFPTTTQSGPTSWDAKMPPAQRRRVQTQHEPLPLDSEELTITPEMLEVDLMRVSDGENLNFSMNDPDGLGLAQMCWTGQSSPEDELRVAGCAHLLLDTNRTAPEPERSLPAQCRSTDEADNKLSEQMRNFNTTLIGKPATVRASPKSRASTMDVNPVLRYERNDSRAVPSGDWLQGVDACDGWSGAAGAAFAIAVSHNEEPQRRQPHKALDSLTSAPGSLTASGGDAFMTELLGGDLQRISGRLSGNSNLG